MLGAGADLLVGRGWEPPFKRRLRLDLLQKKKRPCSCIRHESSLIYKDNMIQKHFLLINFFRTLKDNFQKSSGSTTLATGITPMTPIILAKILFHPTLLFTQLVSHTLGLGKRVESGRVLFSQPSSPGTFTGTSPSSSLLSLALNRVLCYIN